jgi:hypothetical protein
MKRSILQAKVVSENEASIRREDTGDMPCICHQLKNQQTTSCLFRKILTNVRASCLNVILVHVKFESERFEMLEENRTWIPQERSIVRLIDSDNFAGNGKRPSSTFCKGYDLTSGQANVLR